MPQHTKGTCVKLKTPPHLCTGTRNQTTITLANCKWTPVPQKLLLQDGSMESSQHTTQSKQPASRNRLSPEPVHHFVSETNIDQKCSSPGKGRDLVKLTALGTVIPGIPRTKRKLNSKKSPSMHKIQQK